MISLRLFVGSKFTTRPRKPRTAASATEPGDLQIVVSGRKELVKAILEFGIPNVGPHQRCSAARRQRRCSHGQGFLDTWACHCIWSGAEHDSPKIPLPVLEAALALPGWAQDGSMDFVLLHGTTQAPTGWTRLIRALDELGHHAVAIDLPTGQPQLTADDCARVAADQVEFEHPVVVGHSGAGLLLPAVASAVDASRLVWLAAAIPGEVSYREEVTSVGDRMAQPEWRSASPELLSDPVACSYFLFHDCDLATLRWALGTIRLFLPVAVYQERLIGSHLPSLFVLPDHDRTLRPEWMAKTARERLGVEPVIVNAGHCPHVSMPVHLADIITAG